MAFLKFIVKVLIILAVVFLMALPFIMEYRTFRRDKTKKITYKRFRVVVYTAIYIVCITTALYFLKEFILWLESLSFIEWLAGKVSLGTRTVYCGKILVVALVNFAVGMLFILFSKFVRIGQKKRSLTVPKKKNGEFSRSQKLERKVIKFFHTETWFFVAAVLKWMCIILSVAYAVIFIGYQLPALFGADWIPYDFISMLFSAGYLYPAISLLGLWEMYFFLEGIRRVEDECPELLRDDAAEIKKSEVDLNAIDEEVKKQFKDYYLCDVDVSAAVREEISSAEHESITEYIAEAVENDSRNPKLRKEIYLNCVDKLADERKGLLINGNFFSEFSMYFLRYLASVIARGDNAVFVCNTDTQIDAAYDYIVQGLSEISSLYCKGFRTDAVDLDDPVWRVVKVSGEHSVIEESTVDESNILVTSLGYLCSNRFESEHSRFITLIDSVIFIDTLNTVNMFNRQLAVLNTRLKHITKENAIAAKNGKPGDMFRVRYMSRNIRYICFDNTRISGLDKILKNSLSVEFDTSDIMNYNAGTVVRCYKYEGTEDDNGRRSCPQFFNLDEEIGAVMNMAVLCLNKGASNVTVFDDSLIPYENFAESISSNMGQLSIKADGTKIRINKRNYNPDDYSVIIAMDSGDNLPCSLRRYMSMVSEKPALIIVFSRPYMLRDYYIGNIDSTWISRQLERIPAEEGTKKDVAQKILVKANAGGISQKEIISLATGVNELKGYASNGDVDGILREVLRVYGVPHEERIDLFKYFEYTSSRDFDENGKYNPEIRIILRRKGKLFELINGRDMVVMVTGDSEIVLPMPKSRMTQNYISGQNLLYEGNIYHINKVDTANGRIYTRLAVGGKNDEAYKYVQDRKYRIELNTDTTETVFPTKHVVLKRKEEDISVNDVYVSVFRAPMEVLTNGYYEVDPHTLDMNSGTDKYHSISDPGNDELAMETYRRYGKMAEPVCSSDSVIKSAHLNAYSDGALMMTVRICGEFGPDKDKTVTLAAVMLREILHSMFPSVADSICVCPVLNGKITDEEFLDVLQKQPKVELAGEYGLISESDFELVIIEDCPTDLGVVSVLMSAGDDILNTLFSPVNDYLKWYLDSEKKSSYLCFGHDREPECFDFVSLYKLSGILGDDKHDLKFVDVGTVTEYDTCDFCGKRYAKGDSILELEDGRKMCKSCAENIVGNNSKVLKSHLDCAGIFLESTYGITLGEDYDFCFESTVRIANTLKQNSDLIKRGADVPLKSYVDGKKKVHVEYSIPSVNLSELLVRELTHIWQMKHLPELSEELLEGHIALVAVQYLRFLNQNALAAVRTTYYESTDNTSGDGYRKLVKGLLENPQFNNNPFRYLLEMSGVVSEDDIIVPEPRIVEDGALGAPYTPAQPDRALNGEINYFYYSRMTQTWQKAYDVLVAAIRNHEAKATVEGCSFDEMCKISDAVRYDHPELFWYKSLLMAGNEISVLYGASAEESEALQKRIDEAVPKYLAGIDDSMSAYDVALRVHANVIASVDYDTIALNRQEKAGGPAADKIDYLRTVCGVFLDGKAVCEGYARAVQYLLQKCGVECAEIAGYIKKETGERDGAHAWNILKVDGDYYYMDTTWDDSSNTVQTVKVNNLGFDYFCITTDELCRTRNIDLCPTDVPPCGAVKANYYTHNGLVIDKYDLDKIKEIAQNAAKNNCRSFSFKCRTKALYEQSLSQLCSAGQDCFEVLRTAAKADKRILSDTYTYYCNKNIWTITVMFKYKM